MFCVICFPQIHDVAETHNFLAAGTYQLHLLLFLRSLLLVAKVSQEFRVGNWFKVFFQETAIQR